MAMTPIGHPQVLNLNDVLVDMDESLYRLAGEELELLTYLQPGLWQVRIDLGQLQRLIEALVSNARQASTTGGRIWLETANVLLESLDPRRSRLSGPWVLFTVRDDGVDRGPEALSAAAGGAVAEDVALSRIHDLVARNGGHITVSSTFQNGSVFRVYLPRFPSSEGLLQRAPSESPLRRVWQACRWTKGRPGRQP